LAASNADTPLVQRGSDDTVLFKDFLRMRTAPDGSYVRWRYSGVLVGKIEGEVARPLTRVEGISRTRAVLRSDALWEWQLDEVGYFCDLETGKILNKWRSPYTDKIVQPRHYRSPQRLIFERTEIRPANPLPSDVEFKGEITRLADVGEITAVTEDLYVRTSRRASSSLATFTATRRDLVQPPHAWVDCQFSYTTLNGFVGWLGMDGVPGIQNMRLIGVKCRDDDDSVVPSWLRERLVTEHPDFLGR